MFETLSERLDQTLKGISGKARLSEENIADALRDVRMALLEADVALPVVGGTPRRHHQSVTAQMEFAAPERVFMVSARCIQTLKNGSCGR